MVSNRRSFLSLPLAGFVGLASHDFLASALAATAEEGAAPLARDTLVLQASGFKLRDAPEGESRVSGVIAVSLADTKWHLLTPILGTFRVSPDCRRLAMLDLNKHDIVLSDVSGTENRRIEKLNGSPVWAPDGASVMISALPDHDQHPQLAGQTYVTWTLKVDGGDPVRTGLPESDFVSDWSADGTSLLLRVYLKEPHPGTQLFISRPDGTERRQITSTRAYHSSARFSPDGKHIVYISQSREGSGIWINSVAGDAPRLVLQEAIRFRYGACWAPDGERLAITRLDTKENKSSVEIISIKSLERKPLDLPIGHYNGCDWRC